MYKVAGKVLLKETGVGISDLGVEVYDVDPNSQPEEVFVVKQDSPDGSSTKRAAVNPNFWQNFSASRLGSCYTDKEGKFELPYEESDFQIRNSGKRRPDLMVFVMAPEGTDTGSCPTILHASCGIRQNAGRVENYVIKLDRQQLEAGGISIIDAPLGSSEDPKFVMELAEKQIARLDTIKEGVRSLAAKKVKVEREQALQTQQLVRDFLANKSRAHPGNSIESHLLKDKPHLLNYVAPGEGVRSVMRRVMEDGINRQVNTTKLEGYLRLTATELESIVDESDQLREDISSPEIEELLFGDPSDRAENGSLVRRNPMLVASRDQRMPYEKCQNEFDSDDGSVSNDDLTEATEEDIKLSVAKLLAPITSPEFSISNISATRASMGELKRYVTGLDLQGGAADTPAIFDFHSLQIAFEPVWQEFFDRELEDKLELTIRELKLMGGDPESLANDERDLFEAIRLEARNVANVSLGAETQVVPGVMNSFTDIVGNVIETGLELIAGNGNTDRGGGPVRRDHRRDHRRGDNGRDWETVPSRRGEQAGSQSGEGPRDVRYHRVNELIEELERLLQEDYAFTVFGADGNERSVNFGLLVTYRQTWDSLGYQAGQLVKTIPLAPNEEKTYVIKRKSKKSYAEKTSESAESLIKSEETETERDISKIVRNAEFNTSFNYSNKIKVSVPKFNLGSDSTVSWKKDRKKSSSRTKETFREQVRKSAEEYKNSSTTEVSTSETEEFEAEESGKLKNENQELVVNCLFYELQRRFRVSEQIHKLTPVVLIAQEVPKPHEVNASWLIAHDWILRRVILDDSFLPALGYLSSGRMVSDQVILDTLLQNLEDQRELVQSLNRQLNDFRSPLDLPTPEGFRGVAHELLVEAARDKYGLDWQENEEAIRFVYGDFTGDIFARRKREKAEFEQRLEHEATLLNKATEEYTEAYRQYQMQQVEVMRLRLHVRKNIIYYMQAIWDYEHPDQRYLRLYNTPVPSLRGNREYRLVEDSTFLPTVILNPPPLKYEVKTTLELEEDEVPLVEVADLNNLLGYLGNYMIFPLEESNDLTTFMMAPYIDAHGGIQDPDDFGNYTLADLDKYICSLQKNLSEEDFESLKPSIEEIYRTRLNNPRPDSEEIVVPTGSLFIEALPGEHPILEDFKLMHRAIDVKATQAKLRSEELNNVRLAARLLASEYGDPNIEKKIVIQGNTDHIIVPPGDE